jgi:AcrR family transcriptional regulator
VRVRPSTNHNQHGAAAGLRNPAGRQESLIVAATKLFARHGYEATRTAEIAACAGCAEGLIHRYFGGKKGLLLALIQRRVSKEVVELTDQLPMAPTLEEEVLQLVEWEVRNMWHDRDFLRVIISRRARGTACRQGAQPGGTVPSRARIRSASLSTLSNTGRCRMRRWKGWHSRSRRSGWCSASCGRFCSSKIDELPGTWRPRSQRLWCAASQTAGLGSAKA